MTLIKLEFIVYVWILIEVIIEFFKMLHPMTLIVPALVCKQGLGILLVEYSYQANGLPLLSKSTGDQTRR